MHSAPEHQKTEQPGLAARICAVRLLAAVIDSHTSLDGLMNETNGHRQYLALMPNDRSLVRAIVISALRHRCTIDAMLATRLNRPLPAKASTLSHVLHVAAAQILFLDVPDSAAVNLAVSHAKIDPRTRRFGPLTNAVLRGIAQIRDTQLSTILDSTIDTPAWLADRLSKTYGEATAQSILAAFQNEAPFDFTVKSEPEYWAGKLGGFVLPTGSVRVEKLNVRVTQLPGYADGNWWVQDTAASLPARLFGDITGKRIADLCAAPGGKTLQLAWAGARVSAFDISSNRLTRLRENLRRVDVQAELLRTDILNYSAAEPFDAVLLDAPCSSTGTIRRHPDIAWTKTPDDIERLAGLQRRMLERAISLVRPGGMIVYANCSLDPIEGELLYAKLLRDFPTICNVPIYQDEIAVPAKWITAMGTLRTTPADLPGSSPAISGMDGFFAARMRKRG